jgi:hypothetical protein
MTSLQSGIGDSLNFDDMEKGNGKWTKLGFGLLGSWWTSDGDRCAA